MDIQSLLGQLSMSQNPMAMVLNMLPNQNMKSMFSNIMSSSSDQERAQKIADLCNRNGITKEQLEAALKQNRF